MPLEPYETLGVPRDATDAQIKKAWRKKAQQLHPDKHPDDPFAGTRFGLVQEAFEILSDPARRASYDAGLGPDKSDLPGRAREALIKFAVTILEQAEKTGQLGEVSLISSMSVTISDSIKSCATERMMNERTVRQIEKQLKRFKRKGDGNNLFADLLNNRLDEVKKRKANCLRAHDEMVEALKMLEDYEDIADILNEPPKLGRSFLKVGFNPGWGSGTSSTY